VALKIKKIHSGGACPQIPVYLVSKVKPIGENQRHKKVWGLLSWFRINLEKLGVKTNLWHSISQKLEVDVVK